MWREEDSWWWRRWRTARKTGPHSHMIKVRDISHTSTRLYCSLSLTHWNFLFPLSSICVLVFQFVSWSSLSGFRINWVLSLKRRRTRARGKTLSLQVPRSADIRLKTIPFLSNVQMSAVTHRTCPYLNNLLYSLDLWHLYGQSVLSLQFFTVALPFVHLHIVSLHFRFSIWFCLDHSVTFFSVSNINQSRFYIQNINGHSFP